MQVAAILLLVAPIGASAQRANFFSDPQNLEVLPKDISPVELRRTMRGFSLALGVRCDTCHVGEPDAPLDTYDFAADDKPAKLKARHMLRMVDAINSEYVPRLDAVDDASRLEVRCVTCHRGRPQPKLIEDELDEAYADGGIDAAVERYNELREQFHGSHSYDFSEYPLPFYARTVARMGSPADAVVLAKINTGYFPDSYYSFFTLGELQAQAGNAEAAVAAYTRAVEINPAAKEFIDGRIAAATAAGEPD